MSSLKVVAYEKCSPTRGSIYSDLTLENVWYFGKVVANERWSLTRGGRRGRFDCITTMLGNVVRKIPIFLKEINRSQVLVFASSIGDPGADSGVRSQNG